MNDPLLKTSRCRWISVPGAADARGQINFLAFDQKLGFTPRRLFWLHHIAPGQWRGRHGHRESHLVTLILNGACTVHLDDGRTKETVVLDDPSKALHIGPLVWHELTDFAAETVVLVIASTLYDEGEYLRDYEAFKRAATGRPA
ncbi:MAG: FdtA/QdtA family cupin domain-containing protein [Reyranella sp.]|jgi:dTDP-4-dehydrorhamnose 3,5-epimerase-like enzyme|nr:FdtA/QdtA family cupin domain-containing protein [Reyranella sp.]